MNASQQKEFDKEFCDKMIVGRKNQKEYAKVLLTFGDFFLKRNLTPSTSICNLIVRGEKICKLMTTNMEAMMRTIIYIGCSKDWPNYLRSKEYSEWVSSNEKQIDNTIEFEQSPNDEYGEREEYCEQDDDEDNESTNEDDKANKDKAESTDRIQVSSPNIQQSSSKLTERTKAY